MGRQEAADEGGGGEDAVIFSLSHRERVASAASRVRGSKLSQARIPSPHGGERAQGGPAGRFPNKASTPAWGGGGASACSSCAPQDQVGVADLVAAMAGNERDRGVFHLPLGGISVAHLAHAFDDLQHAFRMR